MTKCLKGGCLTIKEIKESQDYHSECMTNFLNEHAKQQGEVRSYNQQLYSKILDFNKVKGMVLKDLKNQRLKLSKEGVDVSNSNAISEIEYI